MFELSHRVGYAYLAAAVWPRSLTSPTIPSGRKTCSPPEFSPVVPAARNGDLPGAQRDWEDGRKDNK
jgi:hypothetical protein